MLFADELLRLGVVVVVDVAQCDQPLGAGRVDRRLPLVDDADDDGAELGVGRFFRKHGRRGEDFRPGGHTGRGGGALEELTTSDLLAHGISFDKSRGEEERMERADFDYNHVDRVGSSCRMNIRN